MVGGVTLRLPNRKQNNRVRRNRNRQSGGSTLFPSQIQATIQIDKVIRFKASAALTNAVVSSQDLLDLMCVATAANAAYRLPSAGKLRRIQAWAPPSSTGAAVTLALEDLGVNGTGGFSGPSRRVEDVTMGQSRPAHVVFVPGPQSLTSKWFSENSAYDVFSITCPADTTFDVHASWTLQDGEAPVAVGAAVSGATAGALYIRSLNSSGSNNIPPVSYSTI